MRSARSFAAPSSFLLALSLLTAAVFAGSAHAEQARPAPSLIKASSFSVVYPLMTPRLSSGFGQRKHPIRHVIAGHAGVDLAVPAGTPIRAIKNGVVVFADPYGGYGNLVVIKHQNVTSHYGHCAKFLVSPGQKVKAGQVIAIVGSTGQVTGPHLHFEIRKDGVAIDPQKLIPDLAAEAQG